LAWLVPVALLVAVAVTQPGFPVSSQVLNDGAVWVSDQGQGKVARFNKAIGELNGGLAPEGKPRVDVGQQAESVVMGVGSDLSVVNPATMRAGALVGVPSGGSWALGGSVVMVTDPAKGFVWVRELGSLTGLRTGQDKPDVVAGANAVGTVSVNGTGLVVGGDGLRAWAVTVSGQLASARRLENLGGDGGVPASVTAVGDTPVALLTGDVLAWPGHQVDLSGYGSELVLQQPGPDADEVVVAGTRRLLRVSLAHGTVSTVAGSYGSGAPSRPVVVAGCVYAAWAAPSDNYVAQCGRAKPVEKTLNDVTASSADSSDLVFRVNRKIVVLNDVADGRIWLPQEDTQALKPNWNEIQPSPADKDASQEAQQEAQRNVDCGQTSGKVLVAADEYWVRAGQSAVLPVLANDSAPACGVLAITDVQGVDPGAGQVVPISDGRQLEFTAAQGAVGQTRQFEYKVTDGKPDAAPVSGTVTVHVESDDGDPHAPTQTVPGRIEVEQDAEATYQVLTDFQDLDSDPMYLVSAKSDDAGMPLHFTSDGTLTVTASGNVGTRTVNVVVSDGRGGVGKGQVVVQVSPVETLTPQLTSTIRDAYVGQKITVDALKGLKTFTSDEAVLSGVVGVSPAGPDVKPDLDDGTFTFQDSGSVPSGSVASFYVTVQVTAGALTGQGQVRIDVSSYPAVAPAPVAVVDTAYVAQGRPVMIDPLANDVVPPDQVPLVTKVASPDPATGVTVSLIDRDLVKIEASGKLDGAVDFTYQVASGSGTSQQATGHIRVVEVPADAGQAPVVSRVPDQEVRTGGVVTIPVLDYATDPDGQTVTLVSSASSPVVAPGGAGGMLFVSGSTLRYQAGAGEGSVDATFLVSDPDGNVGTGRVHIRVRQSAGDLKAPPSPKDLTARVFSGETVRVSVPLTGIDVDGDGVLLQGAASVPAHGMISAVGPDWIDYTADLSFQGTDRFTYAVEDWVGLRSVATVTVGVAARPQGEAVVEVSDDRVTVRPGVLVQARVLDNDQDTGGGDLSLCGTPVSGPGVQAHYDGVRVVLTAPQAAGASWVTYQACAKSGATGRATLTVVVDPTAAFGAPVAPDVIVPAAETVDKKQVTVDVMNQVSNPSGPLTDLVLSLPDGVVGTTAQVLSDGRVQVVLGAKPQMVPYLVTNRNPKAGGVQARGYISVPAYADFPPELRPNWRDVPLATTAGVPLVISLAEFVRTVPGTWVSIPDCTTGGVDAQGAKPGAPLCADGGKALSYTPATSTQGVQAVEFGVDDSSGGANPKVRYSVLTLYVTVTGLGQARHAEPLFTPPTVPVPQGDGVPVQINLASYVKVPGVQASLAGPGLKFQMASSAPVGFTGVAVSPKGVLSAQVGSAGVGAKGQLVVQVAYLDSVWASGTVTLVVTATNKAKAAIMPVGDFVLTKGNTRRVELFKGAVNPFPAKGPLILVSYQVAPATGGITAKNLGGGVLQLTASQDPSVFTVTVSYTVNDQLRLPAREVSGVFTVSVEAPPGAPTAPVLGPTGSDGSQPVSWEAPAANGSPITDYKVKASTGEVKDCGAVTSCTVTGLVMGGEYWFQVQAINSVGASAWSGKSRNKTVDIPPDAPAAPGKPGGLVVVAGDKTLTVSWQTPASRGSAVSSYDVDISPEPSQGRGNVRGWTTTTVKWDGNLKNGTTYTIQVRANNKGAQSDWTKTTGIPVGAPGAPTGLAVSRVNSSEFEVDWTAGSQNGAGAAGGKISYEVWTASRAPGAAGFGALTEDTSANVHGTGATFTATAPLVYEVQVKAVSSGSKDTSGDLVTPSDQVVVKQQWAKPTAPSGLTVTSGCTDQKTGGLMTGADLTKSSTWCTYAAGAGKVSATWTAPDPSVEPYVVDTAGLYAKDTLVKSPINPTASSADFTNVAAGAYTVKVTATIIPGDIIGYDSDQAPATTPSDNTPGINVYTLPTTGTMTTAPTRNAKDSSEIDLTYDTSEADAGNSTLSIEYAYVKDGSQGKSDAAPTFTSDQVLSGASFKDPSPTIGFWFYVRTCNALGCANTGADGRWYVAGS
jgi:hypothetical protein